MSKTIIIRDLDEEEYFALLRIKHREKARSWAELIRKKLLGKNTNT